MTIKVKDQMMIDRTPTRSSYEGSLVKVELNTYSGLCTEAVSTELRRVI